jgi:hypothetical protein
MEKLFGHMNIKVGSELCDEEYKVITVHSEWNFIFHVGKDRTLVAYDIDRRKVHVLHAHVIRFFNQEGISICTGLTIFLMLSCSWSH